MTAVRPIHASSWARQILAVFLLAIVCLWSGCERRDPMAPLPPHYSPFYPDNVPLIILGEVLTQAHAVAAQHRSEWDNRPFQLMTVRVRVEQVLQGEQQPREIDIFYCSDLGGGSYSLAPVWRDLYAGHSEMFFLQKDRGQLRTICDGWRSCILWVRTGTHYNFKAEPGSPIKDVIVRLLLSRGDHTTDQEMMDAIDHPEWRWGNLPVFKAMKQLAADEKSPVVKALALQELKNIETHYGPIAWEPCGGI